MNFTYQDTLANMTAIGLQIYLTFGNREGALTEVSD